MTFFIDYLKKTADLLKEAFTFKKYQAMPAGLAVFLGLIVLPFVLASFSLAAALFVGGFVYKVIAAPVLHLHDIVHKEGQSVKHATQFIVYLISWGFIFVLYATAAFLLITLSVIYALFALLTYLWTFGGFKLHFFADETDDLSITVDKNYPTVLPLMLLLSVIVLLFIVPIFNTLSMLLPLHISQITVDLVIYAFKASVSSMIPAYLAFTALYSAIGLCPYPKAAVAEVGEPDAPVFDAPETDAEAPASETEEG